MHEHHEHGPGHFDPHRLHAMEERRRAEMPPEDVLKAFVRPDMRRFADIGCGSGFFTVAAAQLLPDARVFAVDRQQDMLDFVASRIRNAGLTNVETVQADATRLPFADGELDAVLMANVFHDIPERDEMRAEVYRVLKPGGTFFLVEWEKDDTPMGPPQEIRIGSDELTAILVSGGFKVERIEHGPGSTYRVTAVRSA